MYTGTFNLCLFTTAFFPHACRSTYFHPVHPSIPLQLVTWWERQRAVGLALVFNALRWCRTLSDWLDINLLFQWLSHSMILHFRSLVTLGQNDQIFAKSYWFRRSISSLCFRQSQRSLSRFQMSKPTSVAPTQCGSWWSSYNSRYRVFYFNLKSF